MSETENGWLGLHGTKHSKCDHLITLGFKGLRQNGTRIYRSSNTAGEDESDNDISRSNFRCHKLLWACKKLSKNTEAKVYEMVRNVALCL